MRACDKMICGLTKAPEDSPDLNWLGREDLERNSNIESRILTPNQRVLHGSSLAVLGPRPSIMSRLTVPGISKATKAGSRGADKVVVVVAGSWYALDA